MNKLIRDLFYTNTLHEGEWYGRKYIFNNEKVFEINDGDITLRNIIVMKSDDVENIISLKETFREIGYNYTKNIEVSKLNTLQELLEALEKEYEVMRSAVMADRDLVLMQDHWYETPRDGVLYQSTKYRCAYSDEREAIYVGGADGYWIRL